MFKSKIMRFERELDEFKKQYRHEKRTLRGLIRGSNFNWTGDEVFLRRKKLNFDLLFQNNL